MEVENHKIIKYGNDIKVVYLNKKSRKHKRTANKKTNVLNVADVCSTKKNMLNIDGTLQEKSKVFKKTVTVSLTNKHELLKLIEDTKEKAVALIEAIQRLNEFEIDVKVEH